MANTNFYGSKLEQNLTGPVSVAWRSPSNIALVKYWGKTGIQLPLNPSLSMTLSEASSETKLTAGPRISEGEISLDFWFDGNQNNAFGERIINFLQSVLDIYPWLVQVELKLETRNTFPHSAGIASSASAFSALSFCLCTLENELFGIILTETEFRFKVSYVARLGSGSACRSIFPGFSLWGFTPALPGSSDFVAVPITNVHPAFLSLHDAIILVNKIQKPVSSSEGHRRMQHHPFIHARIAQANKNTSDLVQAIAVGDKDTFIRVVENEALTLHALMMTSDESYMLLQPETIDIINQVRTMRREHSLHVCFTLDAGPNVHILYFDDESEQVEKLIVEDILNKNKQHSVIYDFCCTGPLKMD